MRLGRKERTETKSLKHGGAANPRKIASERRRYTLLALAMVAVAVLPRHGDAANVTWLPLSGNWNIGSNWSGNAVPTSIDDSYIDNNRTASAPAGVSGTGQNVYIGNSGTGTLNISGGIVTASSATLGANLGSIGSATVSSGTWS